LVLINQAIPKGNKIGAAVTERVVEYSDLKRLIKIAVGGIFFIMLCTWKGYFLNDDEDDI
jgi:hypothetical protein